MLFFPFIRDQKFPLDRQRPACHHHAMKITDLPGPPQHGSAPVGDVSPSVLVRGIHYWSANLLVLMTLLHTAWIFLTGGQRGGGRRLGLLLQQSGRPKESEAVFREALAMPPDDLDLLYAYADQLVRGGRRSEAMVLIERIIAAHPEHRIGYEMKAFLER